jgi:DNA oxidative demethylase
MNDLFAAIDARGRQEVIGLGALIMRAYALEMELAIVDALQLVVSVSPFRHMTTPGGHRMSTAMTNCGAVGWVSDLQGYRYDPCDPLSGEPWPSMPEIFTKLAVKAAAAAGYNDFAPDACLINRYEPGARLTLHQDKNERDVSAPIVTVSLGLSAKFLFGGLRRSDRPLRTVLNHGDTCVWGGRSRLAFHGIDPIKAGDHPIMGRARVSLTFRKAMSS